MDEATADDNPQMFAFTPDTAADNHDLFYQPKSSNGLTAPSI